MGAPNCQESCLQVATTLGSSMTKREKERDGGYSGEGSPCLDACDKSPSAASLVPVSVLAACETGVVISSLQHRGRDLNWHQNV